MLVASPHGEGSLWKDCPYAIILTFWLNLAKNTTGSLKWLKINLLRRPNAWFLVPSWNIRCKYLSIYVCRWIWIILNSCESLDKSFMFHYQAVSEPIITPNGMTLLLQSFASDSVIVQREVEAFSFQSLVADCGGALGLFLGFNFLMVWDWIISFWTLLYSDLYLINIDT